MGLKNALGMPTQSQHNKAQTQKLSSPVNPGRICHRGLSQSGTAGKTNFTVVPEAGLTEWCTEDTST